LLLFWDDKGKIKLQITAEKRRGKARGKREIKEARNLPRRREDAKKRFLEEI